MGTHLALIEQSRYMSMYWCFYDESYFALSFGASAGMPGYLVMLQGAGELVNINSFQAG